MLKKSINIKIAESEIEWQKYKYGKIGVRESMGLLYVALKRRLKIVHKSGTTTKNVATYYYYRNMFIFSREIYKIGTGQLALFYFFRYILYSLRIIKRAILGKEPIGKMKQLWCAYIDGVRDIRGKLEM